MRHRVKIFDLGFVVMLLVAAAFIAFEIDIFETAPGVSRKQETVEFDELMLLSTLAVSGVLFYTWRRARAQAGNQLRVAAEREVMNLAFHDPSPACRTCTGCNWMASRSTAPSSAPCCMTARPR
jgi:hypothetical protein